MLRGKGNSTIIIPVQEGGTQPHKELMLEAGPGTGGDGTSVNIGSDNECSRGRGLVRKRGDLIQQQLEINIPKVVRGTGRSY